MDNRKIIQESLDYIEKNLKADINAKELAEMSGFSIYHYYRLFQTTVGMPVMKYIQRRRLLNATYEIGQGEAVTDVALAYGFDTHAGFYKAFKRELGYTPSQFLKKYEAKKPYKINLFQEEHIMVTHKKLREILKNWNLQDEEIKDIYYAGSGSCNDNACYVGDTYVLKFSANPGNLQKHRELSKDLESAGLYVATAIETCDGREIVEDGELYYCLTKRLTGKQLGAENMYEGDYKMKACFVGEIIGQLHMVLADFDTVADEVNLSDKVMNWALPKVRSIMNLPEELCKNLEQVCKDICDKLPTQIIHRDPNPGNIITDGDNWGFIDFELAERNIRIYDPCYTATAILSESFRTADEEKLSKWIQIYKNIILGYDSVVNLTEEEKTAIPYVILFNQLICVAWFSEQDKYEDIFRTNVKMTQWLVERLEELQVER